ncbi:hypothetical protein [Hyella patelloides]|nr:hypothetical protein [Hyella patelloides]
MPWLLIGLHIHLNWTHLFDYWQSIFGLYGVGAIESAFVVFGG